MKSLITTLLVALCSAFCFGQGNTQTSITDPNSGFFVFWGVNTTSDTGLILSGISDFPNAGLMKTDRNLVPQWYKIYPGVWEFDHSVETPDGGYLSLGKTSNYRAVLMKTDSAGNVQWTSLRQTGSTYGGGHLQVLPSGDYSMVIQAGGGMSVARADTNGNILWEKNYQVMADAENFRFAEPTPEYGWIVCGTYASSGGTCLMKLDSAGNILWQKSFEPSTHGFSVHADSTGYFFASHNSSAHIVFRTDTAGNLLWARQWPMLYSNNVSEYAYSVVQNGDELICYGDRYVGMQSYPVMVSFDTSGNVLWQNFYSTNFANNISGANTAIASQDNKIVFVNCENTQTSDWIIKMDTTGEAGCNATIANLAITPFNVTMGTASIAPTVNANPWTSMIVADSIGVANYVQLCDPLSIPQQETVAGTKVYPNPANTQLFLERGTTGAATFELIDATGRMVLQQSITTGELHITIDISGLSPGIYLWRTSDEHTTDSGKIIVE